jgi:molybdate transport system permease protein
MRMQRGAEARKVELGPPAEPLLRARSLGRVLRQHGLLTLASLPLLLFLLLPLVALVLRVTPAEFLAQVVSPAVAQAIQLSLGTTLVALAITLVAGTPLAYLVARRRFPGRIVLETLLDLPLVLPPAVAGIALLLAFGRFGLLGPALGNLGVQVAFTRVAVILAQLFVAAPFYVRTASTAFATMDREIEQAAALDGAGPLTIFWHITLPFTAPTLFGGAVMTWARALGEFGATILVAGNLQGVTQTMPLAIYLGFDSGDLAEALALSVVLLVVSFGVLLLVKGILRRRLGGVE